MLSTPDGPFIQIGRLNLPKYSKNQSISPSLFEYLFYHANDVRTVEHMHMSNIDNYISIVFQGTSTSDSCQRSHIEQGLVVVSTTRQMLSSVREHICSMNFYEHDKYELLLD
jgi:hypothetical protein